MDLGPFITTVELLERHKINLTAEVKLRIPSLASEAQAKSATAVLGPVGGIQILFREPSLIELRTRIDVLAGKGKATAERSSEDWMLLARYVSNVWPITFSFYKGTFTLVLPKLARDLGIVPENKGDEVLIFVCGDVFEIWRPDKWNELSSATGSRIDVLQETLREIEAEET